jgi:hypothetical protein
VVEIDAILPNKHLSSVAPTAKHELLSARIVAFDFAQFRHSLALPFQFEAIAAGIPQIPIFDVRITGR